MSSVVGNILRLQAEHYAAHGSPLTEIELTRAELEEVKRTYGYVTEDGSFVHALGMSVKVVDEPVRRGFETAGEPFLQPDYIAAPVVGAPGEPIALWRREGGA